MFRAFVCLYFHTRFNQNKTFCKINPDWVCITKLPVVIYIKLLGCHSVSYCWNSCISDAFHLPPGCHSFSYCWNSTHHHTALCTLFDIASDVARLASTEICAINDAM